MGLVVAQRNAARAIALSAMLASFENGLDEVSWDAGHLAKMEGLVDDLREFDAEQAEADLRRFLELAERDRGEPYYVSNLFALGETLLSRERVADARAIYTEVLTLAPNFEPARQRLAQIDAAGTPPP